MQANIPTIEGQVKKTADYFRKTDQGATMLQASRDLGIYRANICRYLAKFRKEDRLIIVRRGLCPISKHPANFYVVL